MPERWDRSLSLPGQPMVMDPFASLPFGHGRRACVGRRLAEAQMYILLQKVRCIKIAEFDTGNNNLSKLPVAGSSTVSI